MMRNSVLVILLAFCTLAFIKVEQRKINAAKIVAPDFYRNKFPVSCNPDLSTIDFANEANSIPLLKGWGNYRMPVTVKDDSANIYFQQGINMYYGFHIIEALASFEKAVQFDSSFAMGHWGKALAYGPNINDMGYSASPEALASIKKATALCTHCTALEKSLINAMTVRYSADTTQSRETLNQLYADAMKKVYINFPNSADAGTLYADALMVQHPWDLYDRNYDPKPWTAQIVTVLEQLIKRFPENPGAGHYFIHAVEGSKHPELGLAIANRLGAMMPGVSHVVHMPSHIYIRSGHYNKGITVNQSAVSDYNTYLKQFPAVVNSAFLYLLHNQHMEAACSMMDGQYNTAMKAATAIDKMIDSSQLDAKGYFGVSTQYVYLTPQFIQLRFGKWDELLSMPEPASSRIYANVLSHFARGIAFARKHQLTEAETELKSLQNSLTHPQLQEAPPAFNPCIAGSKVAEKILQGVIAEEKNDLATAVNLLKDAVDKEDGMLYGEPRDWLLPARHFLIAVLLKQKSFKAAEIICRQDLLVNPNNIWSMTGLVQALQQQGKRKAAAIMRLNVRKAGVRADVKIGKVVF